MVSFSTSPQTPVESETLEGAIKERCRVGARNKCVSKNLNKCSEGEEKDTREEEEEENDQKITMSPIPVQPVCGPS